MNCTTCTRPVDAPYRVYDRSGKVVAGCIDGCHTGHLIPCSESNRWHNRKEAKAMRKAQAERLRKLLGNG